MGGVYLVGYGKLRGERKTDPGFTHSKGVGESRDGGSSSLGSEGWME